MTAVRRRIEELRALLEADYQTTLKSLAKMFKLTTVEIEVVQWALDKFRSKPASPHSIEKLSSAERAAVDALVKDKVLDKMELLGGGWGVRLTKKGQQLALDIDDAIGNL